MSVGETGPTSIDAPSGPTRRTRRLALALATLLGLTALELGIVNLPVPRDARVTALVGLAMSKALVLFVAFMRLGREPRFIRFTALVPLVLGPAFAAALMLEAAFRAVTQR